MSFHKTGWYHLGGLFTFLLQQKPVLVTELPSVGLTQTHSQQFWRHHQEKSIHLRAALHVMSGIAWCHTLSPTITFQNKAGSKNKLMKVFEEGRGGLQPSLHPLAKAGNACSCKVFLSFHLDTFRKLSTKPFLSQTHTSQS